MIKLRIAYRVWRLRRTYKKLIRTELALALKKARTARSLSEILSS